MLYQQVCAPIQSPTFASLSRAESIYLLESYCNLIIPNIKFCFLKVLERPPTIWIPFLEF